MTQALFKPRSKAPSFTLIALLSLVMAACPSGAKAGSVLDQIFNKDEHSGPPPEETLKAPFPTAPTNQPPGNTSPLAQIYGQTNDTTQESTSLDQPHRPNQQIVEWTSGIVAQAMTITPKTWDADIAKLSANFTPYALQEYKSYIEKTSLYASLSGRNMRLQTISSTDGTITKEGAISGTYHWLVDVPVMASFYTADTEEIDKKADIQSQNMVIAVQVGRVPQKNNGDIGLVIERWITPSPDSTTNPSR